jgi:hypothetical protein
MRVLSTLSSQSGASNVLAERIVASRLRRRVVWFTGAFAPVLIGLAVGRYHVDVPSYMLQVLAALPFLLVLGAAAALPLGLPPDTAWSHIAVLFSALACIDAKAILVTWHETEHPLYLRLIRTLIMCNWVGANSWFACDMWRHKGERFWAGLRLSLTVGNGFRLFMVLLLRALGAVGEVFPPGKLSWGRSLGHNLLCILFSVAVLTPRNRLWLSQLAGGERIVLSLEDVSGKPLTSLPESPREDERWPPAPLHSIRAHTGVWARGRRTVRFLDHVSVFSISSSRSSSRGSFSRCSSQGSRAAFRRASRPVRHRHSPLRGGSSEGASANETAPAGGICAPAVLQVGTMIQKKRLHIGGGGRERRPRRCITMSTEEILAVHQAQGDIEGGGGEGLPRTFEEERRTIRRNSFTVSS